LLRARIQNRIFEQALKKEYVSGKIHFVPFDGSGMSASESAIAQSRMLFSLSAFAITDTELKLMAAAEQDSSFAKSTSNSVCVCYVPSSCRTLSAVSGSVKESRRKSR
jgi:hypothetical protein